MTYSSDKDVLDLMIINAFIFDYTGIYNADIESKINLMYQTTRILDSRLEKMLRCYRSVRADLGWSGRSEITRKLVNDASSY